MEPLEMVPRQEFHTAVKVNMGRTGLRHIIRRRKYKRVWIPDYNCPSVGMYLDLWKLPHVCYHVNDRLDPEIPNLDEGDGFVYVNFFGVKGDTCRRLEQMGLPLILDLTQAFFYSPQPGTDAFSSFRKFFGVPDGAYLFGPTAKSFKESPQKLSDAFFAPLQLRAKGDIADGFLAYKKLVFMHLQPAGASEFTQKAMPRIDYVNALKARRENYQTYLQALAGCGCAFSALSDDDVPMCCPVQLGTASESVRMHLIENKVFVPHYWPDLATSDWADKMLFLPCDQRYGREDALRVCECLKQKIKQ